MPRLTTAEANASCPVGTTFSVNDLANICGMLPIGTVLGYNPDDPESALVTAECVVYGHSSYLYSREHTRTNPHHNYYTYTVLSYPTQLYFIYLPSLSEYLVASGNARAHGGFAYQAQSGGTYSAFFALENANSMLDEYTESYPDLYITLMPPDGWDGEEHPPRYNDPAVPSTPARRPSPPPPDPAAFSLSAHRRLFIKTVSAFVANPSPPPRPPIPPVVLKTISLARFQTTRPDLDRRLLTRVNEANRAITSWSAALARHIETISIPPCPIRDKVNFAANCRDLVTAYPSRVSFTGTSIVWDSNPVELSIEDTSVSLGVFRVSLTPRTLPHDPFTLDVEPLTPCYSANCGYPHPHIKFNSARKLVHWCLGEGQPLLIASYLQGDLVYFFDIIQGLLNTYNPQGPYAYLSNWFLPVAIFGPHDPILRPADGHPITKRMFERCVPSIMRGRPLALHNLTLRPLVISLPSHFTVPSIPIPAPPVPVTTFYGDRLFYSGHLTWGQTCLPPFPSLFISSSLVRGEPDFQPHSLHHHPHLLPVIFSNPTAEVPNGQESDAPLSPVPPSPARPARNPLPTGLIISDDPEDPGEGDPGESAARAARLTREQLDEALTRIMRNATQRSAVQFPSESAVELSAEFRDADPDARASHDRAQDQLNAIATAQLLHRVNPEP